MNRKLKAAALFLALGASGAVPAQTIDINLNDETLRGEFDSRFQNLNARYNLGVLVGQEHDANLVQGHAGVLVTGDAGARQANVTAGLGGRLVLLDLEDQSGGALGLGGMIEARLPAFNRIGAMGYVYWAPDASSFGDLEGHIEYAAALDYEVIRNASLYVGYRQVKVKGEVGPTVTAETGYHLGLRLDF